MTKIADCITAPKCSIKGCNEPPPPPKTGMGRPFTRCQFHSCHRNVHKTKKCKCGEWINDKGTHCRECWKANTNNIMKQARLTKTIKADIRDIRLMIRNYQTRIKITSSEYEKERYTRAITRLTKDLNFYPKRFLIN